MYKITVTSPPFAEPVELDARDMRELSLTMCTVLNACWDWAVGRGDIRQIIHRHHDHWLNGVGKTLKFPHVINIDEVTITVDGPVVT